MGGPGREYKELIQRFLQGFISSSEFRDLYIEKFKSESRVLDEDLFFLLDELYGDADMYSEDVFLINKNPGVYLDEVTLRSKANLVFSRIA